MPANQHTSHTEPSLENAVDSTRADNKTNLPFTPPKLTFLTPKLTKQGSVEALTAGMIGTFSP